MILQPVFSFFPCSPLPSGTCRTPGLSIPWCCLPTSSFVPDCTPVIPCSSPAGHRVAPSAVPTPSTASAPGQSVSPTVTPHEARWSAELSITCTCVRVCVCVCTHARMCLCVLVRELACVCVCSQREHEWNKLLQITPCAHNAISRSAFPIVDGAQSTNLSLTNTEAGDPHQRLLTMSSLTSCWL